MNEIVPGQLLVKMPQSKARQLEASTTQSMLATAVPFSLPGAKFLSRIPDSGWTLWSIPTDTDPRAAARSVAQQAGISAAQPVNKIYPLWTDPNDPDFSVQETDETYILDLGSSEPLSFRRLWHLTDTNAEAAWEVFQTKKKINWYSASTKPATGPLISVIDTGCDMNHPDFMNALGTSTDVAYGGQLVHALSAQFRLGRKMAFGDPNDAHGHGTHVTGLAVAAANNGGFNGRGTIGTGYNSRAFICRVFDNTGSGTDADAAAAIYYSVNKGAEIINISLGTENYSQLFQDAVTYAWQKGALVVAAGNEDGSGGGDLGPMYPAACSGSLGVSANGPNGIPATTYTGFGNYVDVAAPGGDVVQSPEYMIIQFVYSTACTGPNSTENNPALYPPYTREYAYLAGTSMATPIVAGGAGLYYGHWNLKRNRGWANVQAYKAIQRSAYGMMSAPYGGWEPNQGYGCFDMWSFLMNSDARLAEVGGVEGIVYYNMTPKPVVEVKAQRVTGGTIYSTTTNQHGIYRFEGMPPGNYKVWAAPDGALKTRRVTIDAGCDTTGFDFWCGTYNDDETPPYIFKFRPRTLKDGRLTIDQWGFDSETGIDKVTVKVGTVAGGSDVKALTEIVPKQNWVVVGNVPSTPGATYHLTIEFTNGKGLKTSKAATVVAS